MVTDVRDVRGAVGAARVTGRADAAHAVCRGGARGTAPPTRSDC